MPSIYIEFGKELKRVLKEHGVSVTQAAEELGVSRQAFHAYLSGKSFPRGERLDEIRTRWNPVIKMGEHTFGPEAFPEKRSQPIPVPRQLDLWEKLGAVEQKDLEIGVKRVGKTVRLTLAIAIPA